MQTLCQESGIPTAPNWQKIWKMTMTPQFSDITATSIFLDDDFFLLSSLVPGPGFMWISSLLLKLWQFCFIRDWPETRKLEITPSAFFPISREWGELWIPTLTRIFLIECYWMLQNCRVTELWRENQLGG